MIAVIERVSSSLREWASPPVIRDGPIVDSERGNLCGLAYPMRANVLAGDFVDGDHLDFVIGGGVGGVELGDSCEIGRYY